MGIAKMLKRLGPGLVGQRNFNLGSDVTQSMMLLLCGFQACDFAPHFGSGVS